MMAKLRRRRPEFVRNREPQWRAQENLDYWTMKEEELEINKNSLSHKQSTAQEPSFKHKLMTIPLFRTIGNSVDLARARLAASRSIREYDAQHFVDGDYARPYFLRNNVSFIQPKTIINTEHESKDIYLNSSHSSLTTGIDDFGKWIDSIAETTMAFNDPLYKDQWYLVGLSLYLVEVLVFVPIISVVLILFLNTSNPPSLIFFCTPIKNNIKH